MPNAFLLINILILFWCVNSLSRVRSQYLHLSLGFSGRRLNSTKMTVDTYSLLKTVRSVFPSLRVSLFSYVDPFPLEKFQT